MKLIELIIDTEMELSGIDAISIVENPAIEENWIALNEQPKEYRFAEVDKEKKIIMGAMLVPDKTIYRRDEENGEYYIYFSQDTIRKCMEMFFQNGNQSNAPLSVTDCKFCSNCDTFTFLVIPPFTIGSTSFWSTTDTKSNSLILLSIFF